MTSKERNEGKRDKTKVKMCNTLLGLYFLDCIIHSLLYQAMSSIFFLILASLKKEVCFISIFCSLCYYFAGVIMFLVTLNSVLLSVVA